MTSTLTTLDGRRAEVTEKLARVRELLVAQDLDGALFTRQFLLGWITAGLEDRILRGTDPGFVWALVTQDGAYIVTTNGEAARLEPEEHPAALGFETVTRPWYEGPLDGVVANVCDVNRLGNDGFGPGRDIAGALQVIRMQLTVGERERMRTLGAQGCAAVEDTLRNIRPGALETSLSAEAASRLEADGIFPFVILVGGDERRRQYRHPTVSHAKVERDVILVIVGVRGGLNVALSRSASFGSVDPVLAERHLVACEAEARAVQACRPGATYGDALDVQIAVYEAHGYHDEWHAHLQGGPIGYGPREFTPTPTAVPNEFTGFRIAVHHAVAWNPTVQGAKSEDTFLIGETDNEWITNSQSWPIVEVPTGSGVLQRPAIIEL